MSVAAFARLAGVDRKSVTRAIKSGRLDKSIVLIEGKPKISDPELARREWKANTRGKSDGAIIVAGDVPADDQAAEPAADADGMSFNEARRRREIETWRLSRVRRIAEELTVEERRGELIPIDEARQTVIDEYISVKTKLLGLSSRVRQRIQRLTTAEVLIIDNLVREALESLSDGE
ncbi:MAG: hypothetical protein GY811_23590 [Myxococcales bacterium]|nr:hypothetical protein [Myxococcales bacterium]